VWPSSVVVRDPGTHRHPDAEKYSGYKVIVEEGTDRILGAHLLGDQAAETINLFAVAIRSGMRATDLSRMVFSYPTHASDLPYML
jgi:glutathione reductase (NADPH)